MQTLQSPIGPIFFSLLLLAGNCLGQDFRVETKIYAEDDPQPLLETLTLFAGDIVYDISLSARGDITVLDLPRSRFIMLWPEKNQKTTVTANQLNEIAKQIATGVKPEQTLLYESARPNADPVLDPATGWLVLKLSALTYRAEGTAAPESRIVEQYYQFADYSAKLNLLSLGGLPPGARQAINRTLAATNQLPAEVQRTIGGTGLLSKESTLISRHAYNWQLSNIDHKRIEKIAQQLADAAPVSLTQYTRDLRAANNP